ncbi:MAG: zinc-ribbon domain-containing protein [Tepidiformaceae bacterium]
MDDSTKALSVYPTLLDEWDSDQELFEGFSPEDIPAHSKRQARWICSQSTKRRWKAGIGTRVRWLEAGSKPGGKGACPWCWVAPASRSADWLAVELRKHFVFDIEQHKVACAGKVYDVDIVIPSRGGRSVIVEFDGAHWHGCALADCKHLGATSCKHDRDVKKSRALEAMTRQKYRVIRVREEPLDAGQEKWKRHRNWAYVPRQNSRQAAEEMLRRVRVMSQRGKGQRSSQWHPIAAARLGGESAGSTPLTIPRTR